MMSYSVPLVPLPANLKSRLIARLELPEFNTSPEFQRLLLEPIESLIAIANTIKIWQPFSAPEGSTYAKWKVDVTNRQVAFFLRVPTAGKLPSHRHATGEAVLVLEGSFVSDGVTYQAGDRSISGAKTIHQPTTDGCLILCVSSLDDQEYS
ncbi:MAG: cupin domain-containing protein [Alkalinema sp. CAN_BIN05]|nr:cupin domain-containing protein [Alkalinema sp. CAN_BIN05]